MLVRVVATLAALTAVVVRPVGVEGQGAAIAPIPATIDRVSWLAGHWTGTQGAATVEEHWTAPAGGAMLAVSRTTRGGRMVAFEYLRIVERDGGLVYVAQPGGRPPTEFVLTAADEQGATFENPAHGFPQRIRYERRADGSLAATVSGRDASTETFVFRRVP